MSRSGERHESWIPLTCLTFSFCRTESITLYHLKFGLETSYSVVSTGPAVGRMKILRGDLIVSHRPSRSRVHIVNYRTGAIAWLDDVQSEHSPSVRAVLSLFLHYSDIWRKGSTCHAVELCHDSVIVVQLWGIDVFELPDALKVDDPPKTSDGEPIVAIGKVIASTFKPEKSRWAAAAIVPYAMPYPHTPHRPQDRDRTISILIRERLTTVQNVIRHQQIRLSPDFPPRPVPLNWIDGEAEPDYITSRTLTKTRSLRFSDVQVRRGIHPHFFHDIVVAPASGRGFWIENSTTAVDSQSNEKLMLFSTVRNTEEYPEDDPLIDIGGENAEPALFRAPASELTRQRESRDETKSHREGTVRWCLQHMCAVMRSSSYCSFDDSVGRIVVATHDGKVRVVDLGSVAT